MLCWMRLIACRLIQTPPIERILREGRKFGLGMLLASQHPEDFSNELVFTNTSTQMLFQLMTQKARWHVE